MDQHPNHTFNTSQDNISELLKSKQSLDEFTKAHCFTDIQLTLLSFWIR